MEQYLYEAAEISSSIWWQSTEKCLILRDLRDTIALGKSIPQKLPNVKMLLLQGPLGAGKTSLVKGLAKSLGIQEPITSPTFALAQHYPNGNPPLIHLDLYRLENPKDADELFIQEEEEAKAQGALIVVEWPERLSIALPEAWLITLKHWPKEGRLVQLIPPKT